MHKSILLFFTITTLLFAPGCSSDGYLKATKGRYIARFEKFIDRIEKESKDYEKDKDWEEPDETFRKLSEDEHDRFAAVLTPDEEAKVNHLMGKYVGLKAKYMARRAKEGIKGLINAGKGVLEGIKE